MKTRLNYLQLLIMLISSITFIHCSTASHTSRGSLSEAMEKASDEHEGDRAIETEADVYDQYLEDEYNDFQETRNFANNEERKNEIKHTPNPPSPPQHFDPEEDKEYNTGYLGLKIGSGLLNSGDYTGIQNVNLYIAGHINKKTLLKIYLEYAWSPVSHTNQYAYSIKNSVRIISAGIEVKAYTTPPHTFMGLNMFLGVSFKNFMYWKYKNPIIIEETINGGYIDRDRITWDILSGNELYIGIGVNIAQFYDVNLGGYISPGLIFWDADTFHDFDNDVFKTFLYIKFGLVIEFKLHDFF